MPTGPTEALLNVLNGPTGVHLRALAEAGLKIEARVATLRNMITNGSPQTSVEGFLESKVCCGSIG